MELKLRESPGGVGPRSVRGLRGAGAGKFPWVKGAGAGVGLGVAGAGGGVNLDGKPGTNGRGLWLSGVAGGAAGVGVARACTNWAQGLFMRKAEVEAAEGYRHKPRGS